MLKQHCHDIGLATYVVTLDGELFQLVFTLILIWLYLGLLEPGLGLDSSGLGFGSLVKDLDSDLAHAESLQVCR